MKKVVYVFFIITLMSIAVHAQVWSCGDPSVNGGINVTATLSSGTLTISGTGAMAHFIYGDAPWYSSYQLISTVVIDNGVTSIGNWAFHDCSDLISLKIGSNVTTIGNYAFRNCNKLASLIIDAITPPKLGVNSFSDVSVNIPVYIPAASYNNYSNASGWKNFTNFIDIGAESIEEFKRCPYCAEEILAVAKKCKHCGEWLDKSETTANTSQSTVQEQFKPKKGSFCVEVQFRPLGDIVIQSNPIGLGSAGISAKCFVGKKSELRVDLLFGLSSNKDKKPIPEGKEGKEEITKNSTTAFGLNLGLNYHFNGTERISPYIGFLLGFGMGNEKVKTNNLNFVSGDYSSYHKERFLGMQIIAATGFNWYIVKGLYIGAEVGIGLGFEKDLKKVTKKSIGGETTTTTENPTDSDFGFNFFATPAIRLGWKF